MIVKAPQEFLSPSLRTSARVAAAFELKFLVAEAQAQAVQRWIDDRMQFDPHADPALGNAYRVSSIYCDTPELAVFHKMAGYARRKFRLRRYGTEPSVFLERKTKWGDRLIKRRTKTPPTELERLAERQGERAWSAHWFHRNVHARRLRPICHVGYCRTAYVGDSEQGPIRLTIDRQLVCVPHISWAAMPSPRGRPLLTEQAILELKFSTLLPVFFRHMVYELSLAPTTVSKYRRAVQICGLDVPGREQD